MCEEKKFALQNIDFTKILSVIFGNVNKIDSNNNNIFANV